MDYRNRITIEPDKRSGRPCIRDLGITVYDVLDCLAAGMTEDAILADFPDLERIRLAVRGFPPSALLLKSKQCRAFPDARQRVLRCPERREIGAAQWRAPKLTKHAVQRRQSRLRRRRNLYPQRPTVGSKIDNEPALGPPRTRHLLP